MASIAPSTSRRQMLTAALALPACALVARSSSAVSKPLSADRTAWDQAFAVMRKAEVAEAADAYNYDQIHAAWEAGRPSMEMIHWREFSFQDRRYVANDLNLGEAWSDFLQSEGKTWWARDAEAVKAKRRAALDSIRDFRRLTAENDARTGIHEAVTRSDDLSSALCDAQSALLRTPAPDRDALLWKLDHLFGEEQADGFSPSYNMDLISAVIADTSRLLSHGRA